MVSVSFGEAHDNKSSLDTHFSYVGPAIRRHCIAKKACVSTAGAGAAALANSEVGVRGTHVFEFAPAAAIEAAWAFENCVRYDKATFVQNVTVVADDGTEWRGQRWRSHHQGEWTYALESVLDGCFGGGGTPAPPDPAKLRRHTRTAAHAPSQQPHEWVSKDGKKAIPVRVSRAEEAAVKEAADEEKELKEMAEAGLLPCTARDPRFGYRCRRCYIQQASLAAHVSSGLHDFPTPSFQERIIAKAADHAALLELGSKVDAHHNDVHGTERESVPAPYELPPVLRTTGVRVRPPVGPGLYRMQSGTGQHGRHTPEQAEYLTDKFLLGQGSDNKSERRTPEQTAAEMREEKEQPSGALRFSARSGRGRPLKEAPIRSYYTRLARMGKDNTLPATGEHVYWAAQPIAKLRQVTSNSQIQGWHEARAGTSAGAGDGGGDVALKKQDYVAYIMTRDPVWRQSKRPAPSAVVHRLVRFPFPPLPRNRLPRNRPTTAEVRRLARTGGTHDMGLSTQYPNPRVVFMIGREIENFPGALLKNTTRGYCPPLAKSVFTVRVSGFVPATGRLACNRSTPGRFTVRYDWDDNGTKRVLVQKDEKGLCGEQLMRFMGLREDDAVAYGSWKHDGGGGGDIDMAGLRSVALGALGAGKENAGPSPGAHDRSKRKGGPVAGRKKVCLYAL